MGNDCNCLNAREENEIVSHYKRNKPYDFKRIVKKINNILQPLPSSRSDQIYYEKYDHFDNILPKIHQITSMIRQESEYKNGNVNVFIPN